MRNRPIFRFFPLVAAAVFTACTTTSTVERPNYTFKSANQLESLLVMLSRFGFDETIESLNSNFKAKSVDYQIEQYKNQSQKITSFVLTPNICMPIDKAARILYASEGNADDIGLPITGVDFNGTMSSRKDGKNCLLRVVVNREASVSAPIITTSSLKSVILAAARNQDISDIRQNQAKMVLRPPGNGKVSSSEYSWAVLSGFGDSNIRTRSIEIQSSNNCVALAEIANWTNGFRITTPLGMNLLVATDQPGQVLVYEDASRKECFGRIRVSSR